MDNNVEYRNNDSLCRDDVNEGGMFCENTVSDTADMQHEIDDNVNIDNEANNDELDAEINKLLNEDQASDIAPDTLYEIEKALDMPHKDISEYSVDELNAMKDKVFEMYDKLQDFGSEIMNMKGIPRFKKISNKKFKSKNKMRKASKKRNRGRR